MWGSGLVKRTRILFGAAAFGAAIATGVVTAAPANAALQAIAVDSLPGYGSSPNGSTNYAMYGAGCAYRLSVLVGIRGRRSRISRSPTP